MDPETLNQGDRINHPDFGDGEVLAVGSALVSVEWDRQGYDILPIDDKRWGQVEQL